MVLQYSKLQGGVYSEIRLFVTVFHILAVTSATFDFQKIVKKDLSPTA